MIILEQLRQTLRQKGYGAIIFTGTDPHLSEYPPAHYLTRALFSGFKGSAGIVVITQEGGGLWTDSRYYIEGANSIKPYGLNLFKADQSDTLAVDKWLSNQLPEGAKVVVDFKTISINQALAWSKTLANKEQILVNDTDIVESIWQDRPALPKEKVFSISSEISGKKRKDTIDKFRRIMEERNIQYLPIMSIDEIAWFFDLRGYDVPFNPVFIAYALLTQQECYLYVDKVKLSDDLISLLEEDNIIIKDYDEFYTSLSEWKGNVLINTGNTNFYFYNQLSSDTKIVSDISPVALTKTIKNEVEIAGIRSVMERDGRAMVKFLMWYEANKANDISERDCADQLERYRREDESFYGLSFETIAGVNEHGAMPHYRVTDESNKILGENGLFLLDSGGQYYQGTTDITRTMGLRTYTKEMKRDYTLVLKGHLRLSRIPFPEGTRGAQIDALARIDLWSEAKDFGHGTGHGIGHFLNVHEGPISIRKNWVDIGMTEGMILSNEPGIYINGEYGVRIENLILAVPMVKNGMGNFLQWETLTLCPYDMDLIDMELLDKKEILQINKYHEKVYTRVSPLLNEEEKKWLKEKTLPLAIS
ncbi:aminopeptidase P family protein [Spirochaeta cellobiosiphila]|uniref:aminopeptidase P family protein n=1 Tax=Spirochaeta cellobiosiphila TaxID=504483 RepID=UPI000403BEE5|nr:aminopeptidase P family protein [Spirochaeta cellobiosiphila]